MPNRQTRYGMRSNIAGLTGQALMATVYDVLQPTVMAGYERRRYGSEFSRNVFTEYDEEKLQQFGFTSESYFPALEGYVNVPNLNNAPDGPDGAGDPITFTFNRVYEPDVLNPNDDPFDPASDLDFSHLVIDNILITGYEASSTPRGNENETWSLTGIVTGWRKYWGRQLMRQYSRDAQILHSYLPDGSNPPNWTLVDLLKPRIDALNASIA